MSREKKFKPETLLVIQLYLNGKSIKEIAHLQKKTPNSVSAIIHRARKHIPELEKKFNFISYQTKLNVKIGSLLPLILIKFSPEIQKWILDKTTKGNYESIASFFSDLVAEAYFSDQDFH